MQGTQGRGRGWAHAVVTLWSLWGKGNGSCWPWCCHAQGFALWGQLGTVPLVLLYRICLLGEHLLPLCSSSEFCVQDSLYNLTAAHPQTPISTTLS